LQPGAFKLWVNCIRQLHPTCKHPHLADLVLVRERVVLVDVRGEPGGAAVLVNAELIAKGVQVVILHQLEALVCGRVIKLEEELHLGARGLVGHKRRRRRRDRRRVHIRRRQRHVPNVLGVAVQTSFSI
jgi:hypothetical protein